jgi:TPR repeat protein
MQEPLSDAQLEAIYYEGVGLLKAGQFARAIEVLRPSVNAGDRAATFAVAIAYIKAGDVDRALEHYELAATRGNLAAVAYLGFLFKVMGDTAQARMWLNRAASLGNEDAVEMLNALDIAPDATQTPFFNVAGDAHFAAGNVASAVKSWTTASNFGSADAMVKLGDVSLSQGNVGEAKLYFARAAELGSDLARERLARLG